MNGKYRVEFNSKVADYIDSYMTAAEYVEAVQEDATFFGEDGYGMPRIDVIVDIYDNVTGKWLSTCFWNGRKIV